MFKIFNEENHADYMIKNGFMLKQVNSYELGILCKYYFSKTKLNRPQIREKLIEFCKSYDKKFDPVMRRRLLNNIITYGKKYDFINVDSVKITKNELETIENLQDFKKEKILFAMLVFGKFRNMVNKEKNIKIRKQSKASKREGLDKYFVTEKHSTIMKEAQVSTTVKNRNLIFRYFEDLGFVEMSKKCNFELFFTDEDSDVVIEIDNFKDFIYYYCQFKGIGEFIKCETCECLTLATSNRQKYCGDCWKERWKSYNAEKQKEYYNKKQ